MTSISGGQFSAVAHVQKAGQKPLPFGSFIRVSMYPYKKLKLGFDWISPDVYSKALPVCGLTVLSRRASSVATPPPTDTLSALYHCASPLPVLEQVMSPERG